VNVPALSTDTASSRSVRHTRLPSGLLSYDKTKATNNLDSFDRIFPAPLDRTSRLCHLVHYLGNKYFFSSDSVQYHIQSWNAIKANFCLTSTTAADLHNVCLSLFPTFALCLLTSPARRITLNITAPTHDDADLLSLEIPADTTVSTLKESVQAESRIPKTSQHLYHNGQLLADDSKTMEQLQIGDGDMLALHVRDMAARTAAPTGQRQPARQQPAQQSRGRQLQQPDPETLRLQILGDPAMRQQVTGGNPELAGALNDPAAFAQALRRLQAQELAQREAVANQIARLNADPFDLDAQMRIEEMIREERVQENLQNAIEHNPEGWFFSPG
jgi:DNA damage-inducible protein 1